MSKSLENCRPVAGSHSYHSNTGVCNSQYNDLHQSAKTRLSRAQKCPSRWKIAYLSQGLVPIIAILVCATANTMIYTKVQKQGSAGLKNVQVAGKSHTCRRVSFLS